MIQTIVTILDAKMKTDNIEQGFLRLGNVRSCRSDPVGALSCERRLVLVTCGKVGIEDQCAL